MPSRHSKRLGEAELEIMQILWSAQAPLTARQILQQLGDRRTWALSTLMTALARLGEKGFVRCDRSTRTNLYTPTLSAQTYQAQEGQSFLARLYGNSLPSLVASLSDSRAIGKAELQELRDYLDHLEEDPSSKTLDVLSDRMATMACKAAVKGNQKLSLRETEALIDELLQLENPYNCPHGRPTIISMTKYELEKKFKRIV